MLLYYTLKIGSDGKFYVYFTTVILLKKGVITTRPTDTRRSDLESVLFDTQKCKCWFSGKTEGSGLVSEGG